MRGRAAQRERKIFQNPGGRRVHDRDRGGTHKIAGQAGDNCGDKWGGRCINKDNGSAPPRTGEASGVVADAPEQAMLVQKASRQTQKEAT